MLGNKARWLVPLITKVVLAGGCILKEGLEIIVIPLPQGLA